MDGGSPSASPRPNGEVGYRISGEGKEVFSRFQIRDKIRLGEVTRETELTLQDRDEYRAASTFPELARYFSLIKGQPAAAAAGAPAVVMAGPPAGAGASAPSVASRLGPGLAYPFTGPGSLVLLVVTLIEMVPVAGWVASAFIKVYELAAIRTSAKGSTKMPAIREAGEPIVVIVSFLKVIVVGIASTWPMLATIFLPFGRAPFLLAGLFTIAYAPASFALLAQTDNVIAAINPANVVNLMTSLGGDYALAFIALILTLGLALFASFGSVLLLYKIPYALYAVRALRGFLLEWGFLYFSHLVGWAMYRRS